MSTLLQCQSTSGNHLITHTPGIVTITDANTTIGYCRYNEHGEIEYIFVNRAFRRKGHAKQLLKIVGERLQRGLSFQTPISPLGKKLQGFYDMDSRREAAPMRANPVSRECSAASSAFDRDRVPLEEALEFAGIDRNAHVPNCPPTN